MSKRKTFPQKAVAICLAMVLLCTLLSVGFSGLAAEGASSPVVDPQAPVQTTCDPADNLIPNSGLEDAEGGSFWGGFYGLGWGDVWPAIIENEAHGGTKSLRIKSGDGWDPSGDSGAMTLAENTDYVFSIWYKVVDPDNSANFVGSLVFGDAAKTTSDDFYFESDGNWHQLAISFSSGNAASLLFHWWLGRNADAYIVFDDAYLFVKPEEPAPVPPAIVKDSADIPTCAPENNLIDNPGAEEEGFGDFMGSSENFQYWGGVSGDAYHSGQKAFMLKAESWGPRIEPRIALEPYKEYVFSFWYKVDGGKDDEAYIFKYGYPNADDNSFTVLGDDHYAQIDGQWHQASVTFNSGSFEDFWFYFQAKEDNAKVYFDDFYLFDSADAEEQGGESTGGAVITEENPENRYCEKEDNLIPNYGMELGDVFWKDAKGFGWGALALDRTVVKNGVNSLRFKPTLTETSTYSDAEFNVKLEADTSYTFSVWLYTDTEEADSEGIVNLRLYNGNKVDQFILPLELGEGWHQYAVVFNSGDKTKLTFNVGSENADFVAYFDDFYLCKTENAIKEAPVNTDHPPYTICAAKDNMFPNYNLEGKDTSFYAGCPGWDFGLISITDEAAHSGSKSLKFKGTSPTDWQSTEMKIAVDKNTDYSFSVWVRSEDATNALIGLIAYQGTKIAWVTPQTQVQVTGEWYQFFFQFNSREFDAVGFYMGASGSTGSGSIYVDDFYLFETSKGVEKLPDGENTDQPYEPGKPVTGDALPAAAVVLAFGSAAILMAVCRRRCRIH